MYKLQHILLIRKTKANKIDSIEIRKNRNNYMHNIIKAKQSKLLLW